MAFLKKNKIIIVASFALAIIVLVTIFLVLNKGARSIKVSDFNGEVEYTRKEETNEVVAGLKLQSEDLVDVARDALLELLIDDDKHVMAQEDTEFKVVATGSKKEGAVKIELISGDALITIDNKLNDKSTFEVETPNATMAVRGTTFDVNYENGNSITTMSVTDGVVHVEDSKGNSIDVEAGGSVMVSDEGIIENNEKLKEVFDKFFAKEKLIYSGKYLPEWEEEDLRKLCDPDKELEMDENGFISGESYSYSGEAGYTDWALEVWGDYTIVNDYLDYDYLNYEYTRFLSTEGDLEYNYYVDYPDPVSTMPFFEELNAAGVDSIDSLLEYFDIKELVVPGEKAEYYVPGYGRVTLDARSSREQFYIVVSDRTPGGIYRFAMDDHVNSNSMRYTLDVYRY